MGSFNLVQCSQHMAWLKLRRLSHGCRATECWGKSQWCQARRTGTHRHSWSRNAIHEHLLGLISVFLSSLPCLGSWPHLMATPWLGLYRKVKLRCVLLLCSVLL